MQNVLSCRFPKNNFILKEWKEFQKFDISRAWSKPSHLTFCYLTQRDFLPLWKALANWRAESITVLCWTLGRFFILLKTAWIFVYDLPFIHRTLPRKFFHWFLLRFREKRGQKVKLASFVEQQKQKKPKFFVSVNNEIKATKQQESCFSSDYLIKSVIFAYKRLLSSSVSSQISAFLCYMTGNKAVSYAARYKLHIAAKKNRRKYHE